MVPPAISRNSNKKTPLLTGSALAAAICVTALTGCTGIPFINNAIKSQEVTNARDDALSRVKPSDEITKEGTCFSVRESIEINFNNVVHCKEDHKLRVFAHVTLADGEYPGDSEILREAAKNCTATAEAKHSDLSDATNSSYDLEELSYLTPSFEGWLNGDRTAICFLS